MGLADQQSNKLSCIWCEMQLSCIGKGSKSQRNAAFLTISGAAFLHPRPSEKLHLESCISYFIFQIIVILTPNPLWLIMLNLSCLIFINPTCDILAYHYNL